MRQGIITDYDYPRSETTIWLRSCCPGLPAAVVLAAVVFHVRPPDRRAGGGDRPDCLLSGATRTGADEEKKVTF